MTTALDIIIQSQKAVGNLGVGQSLLAEDVNDSFAAFKQMIAQWQRRRWLIPALTDLQFTATGARSYTVGTGQNFNIYRPDKIQAAYVRQFGSEASPGDFNNDFNSDFNVFAPLPVPSNAVDYPLVQIFSYEDYSRIALKGLNAFPQFFFYDNAYPVSNLFVWPLPSSTYQIHIIVKTALQDLINVDDVLIIPEEYLEALWTNLAIRLCPMYQISASRELIMLAKVALNTIRNANTQISDLQMPHGLSPRGTWNIYNDGFY